MPHVMDLPKLAIANTFLDGFESRVMTQMVSNGQRHASPVTGGNHLPRRIRRS